jgi:hypothetical protein
MKKREVVQNNNKVFISKILDNQMFDPDGYMLLTNMSGSFYENNQYEVKRNGSQT